MVSYQYAFTYPTEFKSTPFVVIPIDLNLENNPIIFGVDNLTKIGHPLQGEEQQELQSCGLGILL